MKFGPNYNLITFLIVVVGLIISDTGLHVYAQRSNQWSSPKQIPGYGELAFPPYLVADQNRTIHAFNNQLVTRTDEAIVYRKWTFDNGWTYPIDILLSPLPGAPQIHGIFLDRKGIFHLIFFAGNELDGFIYYSYAPAINANTARAWSKPVLVGDNALNVAALVGDDQDNLYIVYGNKSSGNCLSSIFSSDMGDTWSEPAAIFCTNNDSLLPVHLRLSIDKKRQLHAVWTVVNERGNGEAVYYAKLDADHINWNMPVTIATLEGYSADWASVIQYHNELLLIYQNSFPATRWMRRSVDDGQTWTDPIMIFPKYVGEYGFVELVVDNSDILHMFLGNRTREEPEIHGMWESVWDGNSWSPLVPITSGPRIVAPVGGDGYDPTRPSVVVSQGNTILVTWWTDPGAGFNGVWYSYTIMNLPESPIRPIPTISTTIKTSVIPTITPYPFPTETFSKLSLTDQENIKTSKQLIYSPGKTILISFLWVVLLIITVILVRFVRNLNRR